LEDATCRIDCGEEIGTGFFIDSTTIITAKHVIDDYIADSESAIDITIYNLLNHDEMVSCIYIDHCEDVGVAMIRVIGSYENNNYLALCASEIIEDEEIKAYGYPDSEDGCLVGEPLAGKVFRIIRDSYETVHDVSINIDNFKQGRYKGFSGSPVMNQDNLITSLLTDQNASYLSAVSIKKAANFLKKNNVEIKLDNLVSFEEYKNAVFESHGDMEAICFGSMVKPLSQTTPQDILDIKRGDIFYPNKQGSLSKLIADIKLNKDLRDSLWSGWLELLTYVEMLKGKYDDCNHIQIEVTSTEMKKRFGLFNTSSSININLHINFFFSESKNYFEVARKYMHSSMQDHFATQDTCNVFNSHHKNFGIQNLTSADIVLNISDPENSGPRIPNARIGVLSLHNLRERVINSTDINCAQENLRERFENAINQSK
jgi:hypothetical protein